MLPPVENEGRRDLLALMVAEVGNDHNLRRRVVADVAVAKQTVHDRHTRISDLAHGLRWHYLVLSTPLLILASPLVWDAADCGRSGGR